MDQTIDICNRTASTVIAMIESEDAIQAVDDIASVEGVDVLLIGSADLTIDMDLPGQFQSDRYRQAVEAIGNACRRHDKIFGIAGVYDNAEVHEWMINRNGVRFMLLAQDTSSIASGAARAVQAVPEVRAR